MYSSPYPLLDIPASPVADLVLARTRERGERAALICAVTGRGISYAELRDKVDHTAGGLADLGIGKGDVCAIFAVNCPEYVIAMLALARLGAIVTTASPLYTPEDLKKQLRDSAARMLFTSAAVAPTWEEAIRGTNVERVVLFEAPGAPAPTGSGEHLACEALAAARRLTLPRA